MNLYDLHDKPESLHKHKEADKEVPDHFWDKYSYQSGNDGTAKKDLQYREDAIVKSGKHSYWYARDILKKPFPKGENSIAKDPESAYRYAMDVLKGPFKKGEKTILSKPYFASQYAILTDKVYPAAESVILRNLMAAFAYAKFRRHHGKKRWPEFEALLLKDDPKFAANYATSILQEPWVEAESLIAKDSGSRSLYLNRFPERKEAIEKLRSSN